MSIWSVFRHGPEKVFAEWMASRAYNEEIQVEPFLLPDSNEELLDDSSAESSASAPGVPLENPDEDLSDHLSDESSSSSESGVPLENPIARGSLKFYSVENVHRLPYQKKYISNDFLDKTFFEITDRQTGLFLIDRLLVISEKKKESFSYKPPGTNINQSKFEDEIVIKYKIEDQTLPDESASSAPANPHIYTPIKSWGETKSFSQSMLWIIYGIIFIATFVLNLVRPTKASVAACFVSGFIASTALIQFFELNTLIETTGSIVNLGGWVRQLRSYIVKYPELLTQYPHLEKFLTPDELKPLEEFRCRAVEEGSTVVLEDLREKRLAAIRSKQQDVV